MQGINERDMQAVVNTYDLKPYYYPTLFPLKETYNLTWKTLEAQSGLKIAADIVARGATVDKKTREAISRIQGDIPKIAVKRTKTEEELTEYDIMIAMTSQNPDLRAIVEFWAEDTKFCWEAVAARIEWMALRQISNGGRLDILEMGNTGISTGWFGMDYQIPDDQKLGTALSWEDAKTAKPFSGDFKEIVKAAKEKGISLKYAFMSLDTFASLAETEEAQKMSASFAANALKIAQSPSVEQVNSAIAQLPYLNGLQIVVIDQTITYENPLGTRTSLNPFIHDVVMFSETKVLGNTFWKKPTDLNVAGSVALKSMNGHTLIKKFATEEPLEEVTMGIANAFPAWTSNARSFFLSTNNTKFAPDIPEDF